MTIEVVVFVKFIYVIYYCFVWGFDILYLVCCIFLLVRLLVHFFYILSVLVVNYPAYSNSVVVSGKIVKNMMSLFFVFSWMSIFALASRPHAPPRKTEFLLRF